MKLYYQPEGHWFGDCMPFGKGDTFYLFHQRDTRVPCPFGEPFGWDLALTKDFVHYEDLEQQFRAEAMTSRISSSMRGVSARTVREGIMHFIQATTAIIQHRERLPRC